MPPSFVSPVPYATSSPTHNGANMPGPMRSTPPHERGDRRGHADRGDRGQPAGRRGGRDRHGPTVAPTTLAILMLLPLSAFEATVALPAAAVQLTRSRIAAARLLDLTGSNRVRETESTVSARLPVGTGVLAADVCCGHQEAQSIRVTIDLPPGARLAVTGASGAGKTTLLMTLAGLLPPVHGRVLLDGTNLSDFDEDELRSAVSFFAEDAHIFATTVRDNLLTARGDCPDDELIEALDRVGLCGWLAGLPEGCRRC